MSMNPKAEDFERLAVRWAGSAQAAKFPSIVGAFTAFPELYARDRDKLPQNDTDRAFALMGRAASMLDHQVVDAQSDDEANAITAEAAQLIDEALKLDPHCFDAVRIRKYLGRPSRTEMLAFLTESAEEVRRECEQVALRENAMPPAGHMGTGPYMRPYLRWMLDVANEQLGLGRYRVALQVCLDMIDLDAEDVAGFRHVAALCHAKLEDAEGLEALASRFPGDNNAWFELARLFLAYKARRFDDAERILHGLLRAYPQAGITLAYQDELPAGLFGHLEYAEGTDDELFIAVSESAVVLDENCGDFSSPLSSWIAMHPDVEAARAIEESKNPRPDGPQGGAA